MIQGITATTDYISKKRKIHCHVALVVLFLIPKGFAVYFNHDPKEDLKLF